MTSAVLRRETFRTSRLLEFCNQKELTAQTGHSVHEWPLVILKELTDNAIDACEEACIAPDILVQVSNGEIVISDSGPGIAPEIVEDILDYSVRVSSREAYVSPTRGAQGNALKTVVAMPYALDASCGEVVIASRGRSHRIRFAVNQLRQEPQIVHEVEPSDREIGTSVTVRWPNSACSILDSARGRFLQIADDFSWLNPHLRIVAEWHGETVVDLQPSDPTWQKWHGSEPTSAHWYDQERFERYIAAHVARDQDTGRIRLVREFLTELRGFSGSAKQKLVLDEIGMHRAPLSDYFRDDGTPHSRLIEFFRRSCQRHSKPVKPKLLGLIGQEHLKRRFTEAGVHPETFKYQRAMGETDGLPWVVETAFGYCPKLPWAELARRRIIAGINFSVGVGNPFRSFRGGEGLEALLARLRASSNEPIAYLLHYTSPRVDYTDRGKTALIIPGGRQ